MPNRNIIPLVYDVPEKTFSKESIHCMKQLLARPNRFKVRALLRPSDKNRLFAKKHMCPALEVVWGDMADYDTIKKCVDGCDYVLHIGAMVSPAADKYLEKMAFLSRMYTQQRFGKTIQMYIPLYITNSCTNHCVYCGFQHDNPIKRVILKDEEIVNECKAIRRIGPFENLLIVTGENPRDAGVDYLENALRLSLIFRI